MPLAHKPSSNQQVSNGLKNCSTKRKPLLAWKPSQLLRVSEGLAVGECTNINALHNCILSLSDKNRSHPSSKKHPHFSQK